MSKNEMMVCKSNKLVNARYSLSEQEQKIILTLASLVKKEDEDFKVYYFTVKEISDILGIQNTNHTYIIKTVHDLYKKGFTFEDEKSIKPYHWLSVADYNKEEKRFELCLGERTKPYFLGLKIYYTQYQLKNILSLNSKYGIRIYEILKSNKFKTKTDVVYEVDYLQRILDCNYALYSNFKNKVLIQSQKEINNKTDIKFTFEEIKQGRKVISVKFKIESSETKIEPNKDKLSAPPKPPKQYDNKVPQYKDFNQRKYDKDFFDSLYKNVNMPLDDKN